MVSERWEPVRSGWAADLHFAWSWSPPVCVTSPTVVRRDQAVRGRAERSTRQRRIRQQPLSAVSVVDDPAALDELRQLLDADDAVTTNNSTRLSVCLRNAATLAAEHFSAPPSATTMVEAALRQSLETLTMEPSGPTRSRPRGFDVIDGEGTVGELIARSALRTRCHRSGCPRPPATNDGGARTQQHPHVTIQRGYCKRPQRLAGLTSRVNSDRCARRHRRTPPSTMPAEPHHGTPPRSPMVPGSCHRACRRARQGSSPAASIA